MAVSDAQKRARQAYEARNKEKTRHDTARRQARRYIREFATKEDVEEVKAWIQMFDDGIREEIK